MIQPTIDIRGLSVIRGEQQILDNVEMHIDVGDRIGVTGANASGKSTLLRILGGSVDDGVTAEACRVGGKDLLRLSKARLARFRRDMVGQQLQHTPVQRDLTVRDNVDLVARVRGLSGGARRASVDQALEAFGITHLANKVGGALNGGSLVFVNLASAIQGLPDGALLIADEPTAALSPTSSKQLAHAIISIVEQRRLTLVVSSHDPRWLAGVATTRRYHVEERAVKPAPVWDAPSSVTPHVLNDRVNLATLRAELKRAIRDACNSVQRLQRVNAVLKACAGNVGVTTALNGRAVDSTTRMDSPQNSERPVRSTATHDLGVANPLTLSAVQSPANAGHSPVLDDALWADWT